MTRHGIADYCIIAAFVIGIGIAIMEEAPAITDNFNSEIESLKSRFSWDPLTDADVVNLSASLKKTGIHKLVVDYISPEYDNVINTIDRAFKMARIEDDLNSGRYGALLPRGLSVGGPDAAKVKELADAIYEGSSHKLTPSILPDKYTDYYVSFGWTKADVHAHLYD